MITTMHPGVMKNSFGPGQSLAAHLHRHAELSQMVSSSHIIEQHWHSQASGSQIIMSLQKSSVQRLSSESHRSIDLAALVNRVTSPIASSIIRKRGTPVIDNSCVFRNGSDITSSTWLISLRSPNFFKYSH